MKKFAALLAFLFVFSVFATACGDTNTEESDISTESQAESEASNDEKKKETRTDIDVASNASQTVVSTGMSYTTEPAASPDYPDTYGTELTDGITADENANNYGDEAMSGYASSEGRRKIIIDLGYVEEKLYAFQLSYLSTSVAGIAPPSVITVYVSLDGKKWDNLGKLIKPAYEEGKGQVAELKLDKYVRARYVRFFVTGASAWFFLDEVIAIADVQNSDANLGFKEAVDDAYKNLGAIARPEGKGEINYDLDKTIVSKGAKYEIKGKQNDKFKDKGKMLTDGTFSGYYEGETWVGFNGGQDVTVKLDLGKTVDDIASIEASFYTNTAIKQYLPVALKIAAIADDGTRQELGILYANTVLVNGNYTFALPFNKTISARYIEFTMVSTESTMYLVEELAVYAYRETASASLYPTVVLDKKSTDWGSGASDETINLVANTTQQIIASTAVSGELFANNTPITSTLMTDGKTAHSTDIHNGYFFKFCQGGGRTVIFDMQHISAVEKINASFTNIESWAVKAPQTIQVCASEDGSEWYELGVMEKKVPDPERIIKYELKLSKKVKARYIVLKFAVGAWAGCDEVEVFGTKNASSAKELSKAGLKKITLLASKRIEPSDDLLNGAKDTCLLYHNNPEGYKVEDLIPYLAYVDKDGNMKDTMFDSFLFLYMNSFPSGGYPYSKGVMSDWLWAANDVFAEGKNIMALEEAAGQVKQQLGLSDDHKYKVILSLYYPSNSITNFGDVDGDGVSENLSNLSDRIKAIQWYVDLLDDMFNDQNFQNIELVGYYWFHEAIEKDDTDSLEMINKTADIVHKKDKDFCWIPYFTSNGYNAWSDYGFDIAVMQPNYVFRLDTPYSNVVDCAELTQLYGMGLEMEICSEALSNIMFFKKYMQYVAGGCEFGYMTDSVIMYYQGVYDFRNACNSKTIMGRMVYDATYHFIKGDLKYQPDVIKVENVKASKNTPVTCRLNLPDDKLYEFQVSLMPDHGSVTLNNDGSFTYYPETDYTGEVKFSFVYSEYLGWSDNCDVTIVVE